MTEQVCSLAVEITDVLDTPVGYIVLGRAADVPEHLTREEPYHVGIWLAGDKNATRTKAVANISKDMINCYSAQVMRGRVAVCTDVKPLGLSAGVTIQIDVISVIEGNHLDYKNSKAKWFGREA